MVAMRQAPMVAERQIPVVAERQAPVVAEFPLHLLRLGAAAPWEGGLRIGRIVLWLHRVGYRLRLRPPRTSLFPRGLSPLDSVSPYAAMLPGISSRHPQPFPSHHPAAIPPPRLRRRRARGCEPDCPPLLGHAWRSCHISCGIACLHIFERRWDAKPA